MEVQKTIITFAKRIVMEQIRTNTEIFKQNFCLPKKSKEEVDDTLMSEEEFFAKLEISSRQAREGKVHTMKPNQTVREFLNELLCIP